uniref:Uncharacterized protein n=1 Tax=Arundo donax TaxID=35708 RepID=A0A0A9B7P5_ARUDO
MLRFHLLDLFCDDSSESMSTFDNLRLLFLGLPISKL